MILAESLKESGKDGAGDAVVCTRDGAGEDGKGCHGIGGKHGFGGEEVAREDGCHASVLHAYFEGEGALLGGGETKEATNRVTEQVAESVVTGYDKQCETYQRPALLQELWTNGEDDSTNNQGETDDTQSGQDGTQVLAVPFAALVIAPHEPVQEHAQRDGQEGYEQDVLEHAYGIYLNLCTRKHQYE